ncbi:ash family protein [Citrobacter sp. Ct235]|uniref:ash family protein n=1 Tax=Citrobacter sp. Ct235 TaxID=2985157 RepID=UPI00336BBF82
MVGWAGASQDAPVSCNTGSSNPVQFTTNEIGTSGGGITTRYRRLPYGYDPHPNTPVTRHPLQRCHGFHRSGQLLRKLRGNPD